MPAVTRLAQLAASEEGFGLRGKIPTLRNNPGDLRHSPHSSHAGIGPNDIGEIDTIEHGWDDEERQWRLYAERGMTIRQAVAEFAPPNENNTSRYLDYLCDGLKLGPETPMTEALKIPAV